MCVKIFPAVAILGAFSAGTVCFTSGAAVAQSGSDAPQAQQQGRGRGMGGFGGFPGGGRGVLGTVTEATAEHYTIKTDSGEVYTVHFSPNTRIMKQGPGRGMGQGAGQGQGQAGGSGAGSGAGSGDASGNGSGNGSGRRRGGGGSEDGGNRPAPQTIKPTDIHVGDIITAGGEMDAASKSIGAIFIALVDPERAKQMREMQANYGKTWLAGRVTAIKDTTITIEGMVDHTPHAIAVDENTSFHQRRDAITLADIQPGEQLRAEGAVKGGVFLATTVTAMQPQNRESGQGPGAGAGPQ
jgi:hypothetical protein